MSERLIYDDIDGKSHDVTDLVHALGYVRVVRCKDCKWWEEKSHTCKQHSNIVVGLICETGSKDYCSEGERKGQEHE